MSYMIPVRAPATLKVPTAGGVKTVDPGNSLALELCPVCGLCLCEDGLSEVLLVVVGIHPDDRKDRGWTNAMTVPVHRTCIDGAAYDVNDKEGAS